ncbi:MAG: MarR family transcriptional regulator [Sedimentibacter sp.]|nr:MarR family transcriptional regulator [Tissierellia bacterium]
MNKNIADIYNLIQDLSWYFGNQGFIGDCCCEDLSLIEYIALKKAYENKNMTILSIGNELNITKSGASKIVNRLEKKGYIFRIKSPLDGRVCCVQISKKAKSVINKIEQKYVEYFGNMLKDLDSEKVENIKESLYILVDLVHKQGFI